jgi:hypothetical protein
MRTTNSVERVAVADPARAAMNPAASGGRTVEPDTEEDF